MASTDALPIPRKNTAYRAVFPILDADGDLVTGAAGLDSEVSKDQGTFADCTNEATEIATSSGMYYLDLTSTEMNADCVAVIVKTSTSGAKTTCLVLYPQETGDIKVDVTSFGGTAGTFASGIPDVNATKIGGTSQTGRDLGASVLLSSGTGTGQVSLSSGVIDASVTKWNGTGVATPDTAGYPKVTIKSGTGTGELNLSSGGVATRGHVKKGVAFPKFMFLMADDANHAPATGLTVTATISKDGGAFASLNSGDTVTEVGHGVYEVDLDATDTNANCLVLRFTASGADDGLERIIVTV